jgi:replicative DNA helicase
MSDERAASAAVEDERRLLGALLALGEKGLTGIPDIDLQPTDFATPDHLAVFCALRTLAQWGLAPDRQAVTVRLVLGHEFDHDRAQRLVNTLLARSPRQPHVGEYARRIRARRTG